MEISWLLILAVFSASLLQAAAGIGFGIIAGPAILIAMNSGAAIQVSILLSFVISLLLVRGIREHVDRNLLRRLILGTLIGAPFGILTFQAADITVLKVLAGIAVLFMAAAAAGLFRSKTRRESPGTFVETATGMVSGLMGTSLAMPGPMIAAFMSAEGRSKETTRATILNLFLYCYPIAFTCQFFIVGASEAAIDLSLKLLPATVIGVVAGRFCTGLLSEKLFRNLIVFVLAATAISLFVSV